MPSSKEVTQVDLQNECSSDEAKIDDKAEKSDTNDDIKNEDSLLETKVKRGRGRPKKGATGIETPKNTKPEFTRTKSDSISSDKLRPESEIKLRRRDKIKGTERYSPEIHEPVRRGRRPLSFPSTFSQNKYVNIESFDDDQNYSSVGSTQLLHTKKMLLKRSANMIEEQNSSNSKDSKTLLVNVKKEENEMILMMPDGTTYKIENKAKRIRKDDESEDSEEDFDDDNDEDYVDETSSGKRKYAAKQIKSKMPKLELESEEYNLNVGNKSFRTSSVQATGIKMSKQVRKATKQQLLNSKLNDDTRTTKITTPTGTGKTVTYITTPKSVTVTPTNTYLRNTNNYMKRNYGSNAKYLNEFPDLSECTLDEVDSSLTILPDRVLLVNSDLPLIHSLNLDFRKKTFLFNQIISPIMNEYKCLLCTKLSFKDEEELIMHYGQFHELAVEHHSAKFSEETVFVCLPRSIIGQINNEETCSSVILNAPCQYCGDEKKLETVTDMKEHYKIAHLKEIKIVEQEEILEMYQYLYCTFCSYTSNDFKVYYKHLKEEHKMYTFICKQCSFFTKYPQRLVTHYRAKHLMSNKSQNLQCTFCNGILIGQDRMNKHIMTSHCVQTGVNEYSCTLCLQPCDRSDQLLAHSYQCQRKFNEVNLQNKERTLDILNNENYNFSCFLCDKSFKTDEKLSLHLNHVHTKWVNTIVLNDTFLMVQHKDGKTDIMPNKQNNKNTENDQISINSLLTNKELEEIGAKTQYGYYCAKCECVIKIYQLYYLHMHNFHKMSKQFECKITSCKQTFKTHEKFKEHIEKSKHPQKSVIEDPLLAIACHNCDAYFIDDKDIEQHNLSDDHYIKVTKNIDKSGMKSEARNFKCKTCHTWFGLMDSFIYHMENESHKHGCPHCGLHFALPSSRRTHIQSVHSDRADICELCNEKQGTKERLFAHLVTHNIVFECNKCMRKFYQREQLNNHMETHGDPINCPWPKCDRSINRTALSNHMRQHKIENSLKCYACDKLFSNKALLVAHVEVHTTAEQNAKAIIANASNSNNSNTIKANYGKPTLVNTIVNQKQRTLNNTSNNSLNQQQPVETTLISITTASPGLSKQRTYANRSLTNSSNKVNNLISKSPNKYQIEKISNSNKIMCFTCNQIFSNHNELSYHKCVVPVVTITGPKEISNLLISNDKSIDHDSNQDSLNFIEKTNGTNEATIIEQNQEDAQKHLLDLAANINSDDRNKKRHVIQSSTTSSSHNRFMESNKRTYDFQNRAKKTYSSLKNRTNQLNTLKSNENQIYIETQSPLNQGTQLILTDTNQIATLNSNIEIDGNTVSTIQALIQDHQLIQQSNNEVLQIPIDQHAVVIEQRPSEQVQQAVAENQEQIEDRNQYIMIQQPDGQCVQICIPEGMDVDEVIKNLNFSWQGTEEQQVDPTQTQFLDTQQLLEQQQLIADQQNQMLAEQQQLLEQQQIKLDQATVDQLQSGEQQVIYLPVNEDGTCAIDAESLAMLTGNGELPIIVSSSN